MRRLVLAALVLLAGCAGAPQQTPEELTPAPVPQDTPTPEPRTAAPGVTERADGGWHAGRGEAAPDGCVIDDGEYGATGVCP